MKISKENVSNKKVNRSYCYVEHIGGLHIEKSRVINIIDDIAILKNGKEIHVGNLFHSDKINEIQSILDNK